MEISHETVTNLNELKSEFLFQIHVKLAPPMEIGQSPEGNRLIFMGESGTFEGPKMTGAVLANSGGDWSRIRADGSGALDVRLTLRTNDGALILMTYFGRMVAAPEEMGYALDFAKPDDPQGAHRYYFRTNPLFETSDARYAWLNHIVAIGKGRTGNQGVIYDVFAIL
ncbi:MAG TPA: DUF3237 domain-containing protein [Microscillaceae bacterium]|nr:DUF3237 domain-containing protein [Microscillaceae bacterium]